jgi:hypothetical protein
MKSEARTKNKAEMAIEEAKKRLYELTKTFPDCEGPCSHCTRHTHLWTIPVALQSHAREAWCRNCIEAFRFTFRKHGT